MQSHLIKLMLALAPENNLRSKTNLMWWFFSVTAATFWLFSVNVYVLSHRSAKNSLKEFRSPLTSCYLHLSKFLRCKTRSVLHKRRKFSVTTSVFAKMRTCDPVCKRLKNRNSNSIYPWWWTLTVHDQWYLKQCFERCLVLYNGNPDSPIAQRSIILAVSAVRGLQNVIIAKSLLFAFEMCRKSDGTL